MEIDQLKDFMTILEKLKCNTRHSWTSDGRHESVAEHSFMLAVMAWLVKDEFPEVDSNKLMLMCLVHDFGEAVTGDIPAFLKSVSDEESEVHEVEKLLTALPEKKHKELTELFREMQELKTPEAKLYKGLDKMEAVFQHNLAPISTWLPLEYDLQLSYGEKEVEHSDYLKAFKARLNQDSIKKIKDEG